MRTLFRAFGLAVVFAALALVVSSPVAFALTPYDAPTLSCVSAGENEITLRVTAGASGAPAGVTIQWITEDLYNSLGQQFPDDERVCKLSLSGQPSLQHPGASRWELGPGISQEITIGDINFDETGVSGDNCGVEPLECGTNYVFRVFAHAGRRMGRSDWSATVTCATLPCPAEECTYTQGYWKNHGPTGCASGNNTNQWPVTSLTLGTVSYTDVQLCQILQQSGGGLVALAHQLIAAKLNVASGASCPTATQAIAAADAAIGGRIIPPIGGGSLSGTSSLTMTLDGFNNGAIGCPAHCSDEIPNNVKKSTWGTVKTIYHP